MEPEEQLVTAPILDLLAGFTWLVELLSEAQPIAGGQLFAIQWGKFELLLEDLEIALIFSDLRLDWPGTVGAPIRGDLKLVLREGVLQPLKSFFLRQESNPTQLELLEVQRVVSLHNAVGLSWLEPDINYWLDRVLPGLADKGDPTISEVTLQIVLGALGEPLIPQLRLDWAMPTVRTLSLPGRTCRIPASTEMSLLVESNPDVGLHFVLCATLPESGSLTSASTFAWGRGGERELQNDALRDPLTQPFTQLSLSPRPGAQSRTLVLYDSTASAESGTQQLQQVDVTLTALRLDEPATLGTSTPLIISPVKEDSWRSTFELAADAAGFELPMLKTGGAASQALRIGAVTTGPQPVTLERGKFQQEFTFQVQIGPLTINTLAVPNFNLGSLAFDVDHAQGMALFLDPNWVSPALDHLGLRWAFKGVQITEGPQAGRSQLFTLVTEGYNYQVRQAEGAKITLTYGLISDESLTFHVRDFSLTPKGITLSATVDEIPVRLLGLGTRFRFHNSGFRIVDNAVQEFTLAGTGALPPDLVGDATADIRLQFRQQDNKLVLQAADAVLRGNKPLRCEGTRFHFSVDRLGLKFVLEGGYHLYFTLTGSAHYALAAGDDTSGPLAWLPGIRIDLMEAPLAGDVSVLARHVKFLIELPSPKTFRFLGAFEMELRAIGFLPQAAVFDGAGAMQIGGQLRFAQSEGDHINNKPDYHLLLIGLPRAGSFTPRLHFCDLAVSLSIGDAFTVEAVVHFDNSSDIKGFGGEGKLQLQGLPTLEAAFSFVRVRREGDTAWVRAWFIALNVSRLSLLIPIVQIYIREIGFGFGYRYTLVAIREADRAKSLPALIRALDKVSRTQGDLAKRDRWVEDIERAGESLRWTVALRAMIAQTSASVGVNYAESAEERLSCLFLFDALIAFRSDLTFYMAVRGWINTNYYDYTTQPEIKERPLMSGYVLLSPRKKLFLARVVSNPNGSFGTRPELPDFVEEALRGVQFSATLLVEPGLVHYELGWPDRLRWTLHLDPLTVECRGGFIFRIEFRGVTREMVIGVSFEARGTLDFRIEIDAGFAGASLQVFASVSFGARMIGIVDLDNPALLTPLPALAIAAFYGRVHVAIEVELTVKAWVGAGPFKFKGRVSAGVSVTLSAEIGYNGPTAFGMRGEATVAFRVMGKQLGITVGVGFGEENVRAVVGRVSPYEKMGLEGGDFSETEEPPNLLAGAAAFSRLQQFDDANGFVVLGGDMELRLETPHYTVFLIRRPEQEWSHFVLFPGAEPDSSGVRTDRGFLPFPPAESVDHDFRVFFPAPVAAGFELEQFCPTDAATGGAWEACDLASPQGVRWSAHWDASLQGGEAVREGGASGDQPLTLRELVAEAFIDGRGGNPSDPMAFAGRQDDLYDERVHNPVDSDFEAAVRGAFTQFRGAPFFKVDPDYHYDKALIAAYGPNTTIYSADGLIPTDDADAQTVKNQRHAEQIRSIIIDQIIGDLRDYAATPNDFDQSQAVAFQLGLVFRFKGPPPTWLGDPQTEKVAGPFPTIAQRIGPAATSPASEAPLRLLKLFNVPRTSFRRYPPSFARVRWYGSAASVALTWDLTWDHLSPDELSSAQADPNQHLAYYHVRRRALDSTERDVVLTVKPADVLHRERKGGKDLLKVLRPRFQVIDEFTDATPEELAALPPEGLRYLYTITPFDFAGDPGRPLTLIAQRYASDPPSAPIEAELLVGYEVLPADLTPGTASDPRITIPASVLLEWTRALPPRIGPNVPVAGYRAVFRREGAIPAGSYGLDSGTQGDRPRPLPSGNARPLPTDIILEVGPGVPLPQNTEDLRDRWQVALSLVDLRSAGVLPTEDVPRWRPDSWQVFIQAVGVNGVPSALAPTAVVLRIASAGLNAARVEERRPAVLEWLARPLTFAPLPAEDQAVRSGRIRVPMPKQNAQFDGTLSGVEFVLHPEELRTVQLHWNQAPSSVSGYTAALHGGYHLLELDADAHSSEIFEQADRLAAALRYVQEVQVVDGDDLALLPGDTLAASRWEAWYPTELQRRRDYTPPPGAELQRGPWYSWRESLLVWPPWPQLSELESPGRGTQLRRTGPHHPLLMRLLRKLALRAIVDQQAVPPVLATDLPAFFAATPVKADPYGWAVLQQFGLSVTFALRDPGTRQLVPQDILLPTVREVLDEAIAELRQELRAAGSPYQNIRWESHICVELLVQPGRAITIAEGAKLAAKDLLAIVQVSLRPTIQQTLHYYSVVVKGPAGIRIELDFDLPVLARCSVIVPDDLAGGQHELRRESTSSHAKLSVVLPKGGTTEILVRVAAMPPISVISDPRPEGVEVGAPTRIPPTSLRATLFSSDIDQLAEAFTSNNLYRPEWAVFRRYIETLPTASGAALSAPDAGELLARLLATGLPWMERFFEHGGGVVPNAQTDLGATAPGPWLATAYPRPATPAHAAPNEAGRLTYSHVVPDRWAHALRYYIVPYGRYDRLWEQVLGNLGLRVSTEHGRRIAVRPNPSNTALDVVLERIAPLAMPVVLRSGRLDEPAPPEQPVVPGRTWEVIVAQHPEQALTLHNQTLARRLEYRQIAFTLLRRFGYAWWARLSLLKLSDNQLARVVDVVPELPGAYPMPLDHLAIASPTDDTARADRRSLDLPMRVADFAQGITAIQWDGTPFYYEHRLLLIAQADHVYSAVNEIKQADFEYRTPDPRAMTTGFERSGWSPDLLDQPGRIPEIDVILSDVEAQRLPARGRLVRFILASFWDSLTTDAHRRWPSEDPAAPTPDGTRSLSSLPDPEVVYQVVERFGGNIEVQAELFFDGTRDTVADAAAMRPVQASHRYIRRRLGRRLQAEEPVLGHPEVPNAPFTLSTIIYQQSEVPLSRSYDDNRDAFQTQTHGKASTRGNVLVLLGVMDAEDKENITALVDQVDKKAIDRLYALWYCTEPVSTGPDLSALSAVPGLDKLVDLPDPDSCPLLWAGPLGTEQRAALLALPGDAPFRAALARLAKLAEGATGAAVRVEAPRGVDQRPAAVPENLQVALDVAGRYTEVNWTGLFTDEQRKGLAPTLRRWGQIPAFGAALDELLRALDEQELALTIIAGRPQADNLPAAVRDALVIGAGTLAWADPAPSDEQRASLVNLDADQVFLDAVIDLLAAYDTDTSVPFPDAEGEALEPVAGIPSGLASRLILEGTAAARRLVWKGPAPTDGERALLSAAAEDPAQPLKLQTAVLALLDSIDAPRQTALGPGPQRPNVLPEVLREQLSIELTRVVWLGAARSSAQFAALRELAQQNFDESLRSALTTLADQLEHQKIAVPLDLAVRPPQAELGILGEHLLIGRATLRYHGIMSTVEGRELQRLFQTTADRAAVARLYLQSLNVGLRGREILVRTRRGSATPSELHAVVPEPL